LPRGEHVAVLAPQQPFVELAVGAPLYVAGRVAGQRAAGDEKRWGVHARVARAEGGVFALRHLVQLAGVVILRSAGESVLDSKSKSLLKSLSKPRRPSVR